MKRFLIHNFIIFLLLAADRQSCADRVSVGATATNAETRSTALASSDGSSESGAFQLLSPDQTGIDFIHVWDRQPVDTATACLPSTASQSY